MTHEELDELLEAMLDAVIEVTGAEKGFILLIDDATASEPASPRAGNRRAPARRSSRIRAARNVNRDAVSEPASSPTASCARCSKPARPVIVSDALTDDAVRDRARACSRSSSRA